MRTFERLRALLATSTRDGLRWRLASGVFWVLISAVMTQSSGFLNAILPARMLGIEVYGRLAAIQSALGLMASLAGLGIGTTAARYVSQYRQTEPMRVGRILGLCTIITLVTASMCACILLAFAPYLSHIVFGNEQLAEDLRLGAIMLFFVTLNSYQVGALSGFEAFSRLAGASSLQAIGSVALMLLCTLAWGLRGSILALGGAAVLGWLIQGAVLRHECRRSGVRMSFANAMSERRVFSEFALPAALSGIVGGIVTAGGTAILVRQVHGVEAVAIFGAATTIRTIALFAPGLLTRVTLPVLSNLHGLNDRTSYRKTFALSLVGSGGFSCVAAIVLMYLTPLLLRLFGKGFVGGRVVVGVLLASAVLEVLSGSLFQVLYSHGRVWLHLAIMAVWSVVVLGGTLLAAPTWGASGLAASYGLGWLISTGLYGGSVKRVLDREAWSLVAGGERG
jgi:O-antigen/teichoic acid export membrane protein